MTDFISLNARVRATIESYFDFRIEGDHPLLNKIKTEHLLGGDWLMRQGEEGDALYLLVQGRLQVLISEKPDVTEPDHQIIGEVVPGDSVGEVSLLTGQPRAASIRAVRDSVLVRIDREVFDELAQEHPALVMRLAGNVANVLHNSTSGKQKKNRRMENIALIPLDDSEDITRFCDELERSLRARGTVSRLRADTLGQHGAPIEKLEANDEVRHELRLWVNDQESRHDFLLFQCRAANDSWARLARRQSDLVMFIASANSSPQPRDWEVALDDACRNTAITKVLVLLQDSEINETIRWLEPRSLDYHLHVRRDSTADLERVTRIVTGTANGLVLAAGAARGFAHIGVFGAMKEAGLPIDWVGGTSIGAIMGAPMAADWSYEKARNLGRKAFVSGKPFSDFTLPLMSLARGRRMERLLKQFLNLNIEDLPIPFFCVSCNLDNGSLNLHERGYLPDALRASAAMTGIIPPAVVSRRLAIDGSVVNSMPVDIMLKKPVGTLVAVSVSAQKKYQVDYDKIPSPWAVLRGRFLPFSRKYRVAGLSTIMLKATELGTLNRVTQMSRQADLLLTPPVRKFGMTQIKSYDAIVDTGYDYAREQLTNWRKLQTTE